MMYQLVIFDVQRDDKGQYIGAKCKKKTGEERPSCQFDQKNNEASPMERARQGGTLWHRFTSRRFCGRYVLLSTLIPSGRFYCLSLTWGRSRPSFSSGW